METHPDRLPQTNFRDVDTGEIGLALRQAEDAVSQAQAGGNSEAICEALARLALLTARIGQYENARQLAAEALSHSASSTYSIDAFVTLGQ